MSKPINYGRIAIIPKGEFKGDVQYDVGDFVSYEGSSYTAYSRPPLATLPTDTNYWQLSARGFDAEHAKNVAADDKENLGFSDVQGFIDLAIQKIFNYTIDFNEIEEAFRSVFSDFQDDPEPPTSAAMTSEDILRAIQTEWNGESSEHPNAMCAEDIEQALNTEWNGESSTNPNAMSAEDINKAIANATI